MIFHSYVNVYQRVKYQPYGFHQDRWKSNSPMNRLVANCRRKDEVQRYFHWRHRFFRCRIFPQEIHWQCSVHPIFCCPFILIGWEFGIPDFPMDCENPPYIGIVYSLRMLNAVQVEMWQIHRLGPLDLGFQAIKPLIERYVVSKGKGKKGLWRLKQP